MLTPAIILNSSPNWPDGRVPELASTPEKILKGAKRGRQRIGGRRNPPPRTEGAQRCGRLFEVKNRPRANPVRGVGGGTGIAEF